jgi:uncharacterized repeat protein (TIGR03806 family)
LALLCLLLLAGCGKLDRGVRMHVQGPFPEKLSEWHLYVGEMSRLAPNKGVVPYDLNTPLFTDYANKHRFIWMPPETSAVYHETETFEFPVGTILSKTFSYPRAANGKSSEERLIETRLLVHSKSGWVGLPYIWNDQQSEATLEVAGGATVVNWTHPSGKKYVIDYVIPNSNQCKSCHDRSKIVVPIGPKARHLNKDYPYADGPANQLAYWSRIGYLKGAPPPAQAPRLPVWDDPKTGSIAERARAYLDINCAHCHNPAGPADTSALSLSATVTNPAHLGVCKSPVAAGRGSGNLMFDIVPGDPDASIMSYRMNSTEPKIMMPELGRTLVHEEGVALIREWIKELQGDCRANRNVAQDAILRYTP